MKLIAKTLFGLEDVLAAELGSLGATGIQVMNRAVRFNGNKSLLYKVNYCARTALSFLMPVGEFRIRSKDDLYRGGLEIEWNRYMGTDDTFSIVPVVNSPYFDHSGYAGLLLKDSVADFFRNKYGKRPSVNTEDPVLLINLHISKDMVTISVDSSVTPLFKRGYRQELAVAPLNEVLAAGILMISGWNASAPLTDPMCGSGTIPIEAGLIATRIPPGRFRKSFGFQRWKDFEEQLFENIKTESDGLIISSPVSIRASDISADAVDQTLKNAAKAGLSEVIHIEKADFRDVSKNEDNGYVFLNPPYGQRIKAEDLDSLYGMIGSTLKHKFAGNTAWLITSNKESLKHVGLKPREKHTLYNGALECLLVKYELYQGTMKRR
jgi:putative N6-adenine-specific DNA methylase